MSAVVSDMKEKNNSMCFILYLLQCKTNRLEHSIRNKYIKNLIVKNTISILAKKKRK